MTIEKKGDRHDHPLCGGRLRRGEGTCRQPAGWGTDHVGVGYCKLHGGATRTHSVWAKRRLVEQEARELMEKYAPAAAPVEDPLNELLAVAGEIRAFKDFLGERVAEMRAEEWRFGDAKGTEQLRAEIALYERALDRTARVLGDLARLGIEERQVRLAERQGSLLVTVLNRIFDRLELTPAQRALIPQVVPDELRRVAAEEAAGRV